MTCAADAGLPVGYWRTQCSLYFDFARLPCLPEVANFNQAFIGDSADVPASSLSQGPAMPANRGLAMQSTIPCLISDQANSMPTSQLSDQRHSLPENASASSALRACRVVMHQIIVPSEVDNLGICFGGQVRLCFVLWGICFGGQIRLCFVLWGICFGGQIRLCFVL